MKLTRLLTLRSILARPVRMLLSTIGIVLGVASILAIGITNQSALRSVNRLFEETSGKASLVVVSSDKQGEGFDPDVLFAVSKFPGIGEAVPSLHVGVLLADEAQPSELAISMMGMNLGGLTLYGIDPKLDQAAREYKLVDGRFLTGDLEAQELVLVDSFAEKNELELDDWIEVVTEAGSEELRLVGLIAQEGPGRLNNGAFGVIPLETAQDFSDRQDTLDQIDVVVSPEQNSSKSIESIKTGLQSHLGEEYSVIYPAAQGERMTQMLGNYQIGLNFMSGMALFVGAFLIYNAFSMSVIERTREMGMLRTIGMTRSQVVRQVLTEAVVLGLLGAFLGVALGILLAIGLANLMGLLISQEVGIDQIPPNLVIWSMLVGVLVTLAAAAIPAWQAGRISPMEAVQIRGRSKEGWLLRYGWWVGLVLLLVAGFLLFWNPFPEDTQFRLGSVAVVALFLGGTLIIPASVALWQRVMRLAIWGVYGNSGQIGSLNVKRSKLRTTLTVAALMVGVAMMIVVWGMTESFKGDLVSWLEGYIGGDIYISSTVKMRRLLWGRLGAIEGVHSVSPVRYLEIEWQTPEQRQEDVTFMAVDPIAYDRVTSFLFSQIPENSDPQQAMMALAEGNTVFVSTVVAEKYGLEPGDMITLKTKFGDREFKIAAVVVDYYNQGLVIDGSWQDMERYFRVKDANMLLVKVQPGYRVEDVQERIENILGDRFHLTVESNQTLKQQVNQLMGQAFSMFDVLAIIAMIIAFLGITNTLTMNVMERTQEIGMLRSIGMTRGQVVGMIMAEAGLMGVIGGVMGLLFGLILSRILLWAMSAMSGYEVSYLMPAARVALGLLIAIAVAQLAAVLPANRAARTSILEAIHQE
jgi:putative ABC transport system permease protein